MIPPRWRKMLRDLSGAAGRQAMIVAAICAGVLAVTTFVSAYVILDREISRNYLDTHPASALLEVTPLDDKLMRRVRAHREIAAAEPAAIVLARVRTAKGGWTPILLFVIEDFDRQAIGRFNRPATTAAPGPGEILIEREAQRFLGLTVGDGITVRVPDGADRRLKVSGVVHDPGLAPAWQEQMAYGYITPGTYAMLGGSPPDLVKVVVRNGLHDQARTEAVVADLAKSLRSEGYRLSEIRIPPTGRHPHQFQMAAILILLTVFAVLTLALSAILTAATINGMLAQQIRQIAVMKAVGARSGQISQLYLISITGLAAVATACGIPLGLAAARGFAGIVSQLLNFTLFSQDVPGWVLAVLGVIGIVIPVVFTWIPVRRAARRTVREALGDYGTTTARGGRVSAVPLPFIDRTLAMAIRNLFRKRGRLMLNLLLLGVAGGLFMASLNVAAAWRENLTIAAQDRLHDIEVRLTRPQPEGRILPLIRSQDGVASVLPWSLMPAAQGRTDGLEIVRTYPDGGHGSFNLRALPGNDALDHLQLIAGRRLLPGEQGAVVLNSSAHLLFPDITPGGHVVLTVEGRTARYRVAGIVRELLIPASAYVSQSDFDRATGLGGQVNAMRIYLNGHDAQTIDRAAATVENAFADNGIGVKIDMPETLYDRAAEGHIRILITALVLMSVLMAAVGTLGLASSQGLSVAERTREFGIMRTLGGTSGVILRNVIAEGLLTGAMSLILAGGLSVPLSLAIGTLLGHLAFGLPLPLVISDTAILIWIGLVIAGSLLASYWPARRAAALTIRETLSYT